GTESAEVVRVAGLCVCGLMRSRVAQRELRPPDGWEAEAFFNHRGTESAEFVRVAGRCVSVD
ncbi:MAG: hypothetical protein ACK5ES_01965, partial [Planctomyces sp.]